MIPTNNNFPPTPVGPTPIHNKDNGDQEGQEQKESLFEKITQNWFVSWILVPAALIFVLHFYVFSAYHVVGSSMVPTLHDSDYLIISKVERTGSVIQGKKYIPDRNEIIVFHYPKQPTLDFVKRVIGLPGDRVVIKDGKVTVYNSENPNGFNPDSNHKIEGNYTLAGFSEETLDVVVPEGNVFVLGDNRTPNGSSDSREWGMLPSEDIVGNVVLRLYPFNSIQTFF